MVRPLPAILLLVLFAAAPLHAQSLRGRLRAADGSPIPGAIVTLVDSGGAVVARVLSSPLGSYVVRAPVAGSYSLRVLRIGFAPFTTAPALLAVGGTVENSPTLPDDPIVLNELEVSAGGACRDGDATGATAALLEEVSKAFGSAELALQDRDLRFEVLRKVERSGMYVEHVADSALSALRVWPVISLPAEQLRDRGFVQSADSVDPNYVPLGAAGKVWFGPDALTFFSTPFLATHCYRVRLDSRDSDHVRLEFKPSRGRRLPDIEGVLWVRRSTLALERIEYDYVNLPRHLTEGGTVRPRGRMDLLQLPSGIWIVSRWSLTVPIERERDHVPIGVAGWLEQGGEIRHIRTVAGEQIY